MSDTSWDGETEFRIGGFTEAQIVALSQGVVDSEIQQRAREALECLYEPTMARQRRAVPAGSVSGAEPTPTAADTGNVEIAGAVPRVRRRQRRSGQALRDVPDQDSGPLAHRAV